jgi:acetylornithine deacetylase
MGQTKSLDTLLSSYVEKNSSRLIELIQELVRTPSENTPPIGRESACQQMIARHFTRMGMRPELYELKEVEGLKEHPSYWPGRNNEGRPNLGVRLSGMGGGRSLILSGHIDTVPRGTQPWSRDPFSGHLEGNFLYGRGSNDMKGGVGTNLFVIEALHQLGIKLKGDLIFETVIDEEFGGVNGTLASRLKGFHADAAVLSEPSFLRICPAQRGGRTIHITLQAAGGILTEDKFPAGVIDQLRYLLNRIPDFAELRRKTCPSHPYFAGHPDPVPVAITKISTGPWGTQEPISTPETCQVEFYWQAMPGESQVEIEQQFARWFEEITRDAEGLFPIPPRYEYPIRWLPGSAISRLDPFVQEFAQSATLALGRTPEITGLEGPCDMYIFHQFGIPAVLWGARGGNTHAADEYLEVDSVIAAAKALLLFVCHWCGIDSR